MATTSNTEELMARFMPARVERELRNRNTMISDLIISDIVLGITVILAELSVFEDLKHTIGAVEAVKQFDSLVQKMDASTVTTGIEKIRTAGTG